MELWELFRGIRNTKARALTGGVGSCSGIQFVSSMPKDLSSPSILSTPSSDGVGRMVGMTMMIKRGKKNPYRKPSVVAHAFDNLSAGAQWQQAKSQNRAYSSCGTITRCL